MTPSEDDDLATRPAQRRRQRLRDARTRFLRERYLNEQQSVCGQHDCVLVLDHLKPDFNIGKIFRTADAFGVREIHLVGVRYFDPAPARGSLRWVRAHFHANFAECHQQLQTKGYQFIGFDPSATLSLGGTALPQRSAFIFGHEEYGLSFRHEEYADLQSLRIPQWGKVQSLNVSVAASVVVWEYLRQHALSP